VPLVESVDYLTKRIYLSIDTVDISLDMLDVYREVRVLRRSTDDHQKFRPMIVGGGNIEKIAGQTYTQPYVQLLNGCRVVPYRSASHVLTLTRETFTDDGFASAGNFDLIALDPGVVVTLIFTVDKVEVVVAGGGFTPQDRLDILSARDHARASNLQTQRIRDV